MQRKLGFTLIELSFAIVFISILSLAVILTITNTISTYHRGLVLNQVNTMGTDLIDDITTAIQSSPVKEVDSDCGDFYDESKLKDCVDDQAQRFVVVVRKGTVNVGTKSISDVPLFGAFCTGKYSYIWNSGYLLNKEDYKVDGVGPASLTYKSSSSALEQKIENFKLLKVNDGERMVCKSAVASGYQTTSISGNFNIAKVGNREGGILADEPIELLPSNSTLAIYDLDAAKPAIGANKRNMLYSVSFILGTLKGGININASGDNCVPPQDFESGVESFDYCSINKFNFAAQAIGG